MNQINFSQLSNKISIILWAVRNVLTRNETTSDEGWHGYLLMNSEETRTHHALESLRENHVDGCMHIHAFKVLAQSGTYYISGKVKMAKMTIWPV